MIETEKEITKLMRPHGYKRKGRCWYKVHPEVIPFLHMQGSKWGGDAFINICALFPQLHPMNTLPTMRDSDLRGRLPNLEHTGALDHHSYLEDSERIEILSKHLNEVAIPILEKMTNKKTTASVIRNEDIWFNFLFDQLVPIGVFKDSEHKKLRQSNYC